VWGIAIYFLTGKSLEIWPLRFLLSLLFVVIGIITRKNKEMSLDTAEWILAAAGTVTVSYAFYVTWVAGLDPIWITGTTLIIIGVLNYLTGTKQAIALPCSPCSLVRSPCFTKIQTNLWPLTLYFLIL
jgi:hypothetical protein